MQSLEDTSKNLNIGYAGHEIIKNEVHENIPIQYTIVVFQLSLSAMIKFNLNYY